MSNRKLYSTLTVVSLIILICLTVSCITITPGRQPSDNPPASGADPSSTTPPSSINPPVIVSFDINPFEITTIESANLTWNITGADKVIIDQGIGEVPPTGTMAVSPPTSTTYRLTATNTSGSTGKSVTLSVLANSNASKIGLTEDDVKPRRFVFDMNSEPTITDTISTYYIRFTRGSEILGNTVSIHTSIESAEQRYYTVKAKYKTNITDIVTIGSRGYFLTYEGSGPEEPTTYSIRFQKNNVYIDMGAISDYALIESFARIVETRIH